MNFQENGQPFFEGRYKSIRDCFSKAFNPNFWRHGLVISQGNDWNVSYHRAKNRLKFVGQRLLRAIFGNRWREKARAYFFLCKHGKRESFNVHWHAMLGIELIGSAIMRWSDEKIAVEIAKIDQEFCGHRSEKHVHVDCLWENGNRYHSYITRFAGLVEDDFDVF
jgi:hypothetical protein